MKKQSSKIDFDGVDAMINSRIQTARNTVEREDHSLQYSEQSMLRNKKKSSQQHTVNFEDDGNNGFMTFDHYTTGKKQSKKLNMI